MNKNYRSIWNEALSAWVAASEITRGRGKSGTVRAASVGAVVLLLAMSATQAQTKIGNNPNTINPGAMLEVESTDRGVSMPRVALTDRATWTLNGNKPVNGMIVYNTTTSTGVNGLQEGMAVWKSGRWISVDETPYMHVNSTAPGNSTLANTGATGPDSIAIGATASAAAAYSTAIGTNASASGTNSTAIGGGAAANRAAGAAGTEAIALGMGTRAGGSNAIAMGSYSSAGINGVAIGNAAAANQTNTVAIGKNAYAGYEAVHIGNSDVNGNNSNLSGAFRRGSTLIGVGTNSQGLYSTVVGNSNDLLTNENISATGLLGTKFVAQGAFSNIVGAHNTVGTRGTSKTDTTTNSKTYSGVAVTVAGSANNVQDSNGAFVAGYGNTITNSYNDQIDVSGIVSSGSFDTSSAIAALIADKKTQLGQVGVIGAANTLDKGSNTLVVGMRNTVTSAKLSSVQGFENEASDIEKTSITGASNKVTGATNAFIAGVGNTVSAVSNVVAMGSAQKLDGTSQSVLLGDRIEFNGTQGVAIGDDTKVADGAVAAGVQAKALSKDSIAAGRNAVASQVGAVALGSDSTTAAAVGTASTAIRGTTYNFAGTAPTSTVSVGNVGTERTITNVAAGRISATSTDAINGSQLYATNSSIENLSTVVVANKTKYYSVQGSGTGVGSNADNDGATGFQAMAAGESASASGGLAVAMGTWAEASGGGAVALGASSTAVGSGAVAVGHQAAASVDGGVALGSGSVSNRAIAGTQGDIPAGTHFVVPYNTTDKTLLGAVSVGNATSYRQITNVADGTEQQDAVTVRQLTGALQSFAVTPTKYFHANSTGTDSAAVGVESVAIGPRTIVNGNNGIGIGNGATVQASAPGGIAIGQSATSVSADSVALGTNASANAVQGMALGAGSRVTQTGGVALGAGSVASTASGVAGYIPPTATTQQVAAIGATTSTLAAVSVGDAANGQFRQITGVAAGTLDSDAVNVSQLKGVQGQVAQIDQNTVRYDTQTDGSTNYNSVTMGGSNTTGAVTVHNVSEGVAGTDAVNVNQLNAGLDGAKQYTDQRFNQINGDVRKVAKEASAGTASAMAMANLPQAYLPGKSMVSVGVGGFDGEASLALGVSKLSDNGRWVVKFSASGNSRGKFGVGAGAGFHW